MKQDNFEHYIENAIAWAEEHLGSDGYPFLCLAFVEDAYEISNGIEMFGGSTAKESADEYGTQEMPEIPPRGAFVFYDCFGTLEGTTKNWGHVGLSLGDGRVIHAWGVVRCDHYREVEELGGAEGWSAPRYIGWTPVARVLQDYHVKG